ncbi:MAG: hypothetical protein QM708_11840 [Propioniciclava sp.]|uniref:hypothetical protein n=1 Tax=Propioniciclava sp. TaxID=2038686 RepID=UPI0039E44AEF
MAKVLWDEAGREHQVDPGVDAYLASLNEADVRMLALELATTTTEGYHLVKARAAREIPDANDGMALADQYVARVRAQLAFGEVIYYDDAYTVAAAASEVLTELEYQLDSGRADAVAPALLEATVLLRDLVERADDSDGEIGDACQQALDLYARACREGNPNRVQLAYWLSTFRVPSPGWPEVTLSDFVDAFDDEAMDAYRAAVSLLALTYEDTDEWGALGEIRRMQLELADHDGDVDEAIRILSRPDRADYGGIVRRLRTAGREDEVAAWIDRAVESDAVSAWGASGRQLGALDVAEFYLAHDRADDALTMLRTLFSGRPSLDAYRILCDIAGRLGRADAERAWAIGVVAASAPHEKGALLVSFALADDDLDRAWTAADEYGPGRQWQALAAASESTHPRRAADLYRPSLMASLVTPNTRLYPGIARTLATMRRLYAAAGLGEQIDAEIRLLREQYRRRSALMRELDAQRLP